MEADWTDSEAPWWAKLRRAYRHIEEVRARVTQLDDSGWSVEREPGEAPSETTYRLRVHRPIPADLTTAVGDAVHNMRSSLDCVTYALARRHLGRDLTEKEEEQTKFPIRKSRLEFDAYFKHEVRGAMFGQHERAGMCSVKPFAFSEEATSHGVVPNNSPDEDYRFDVLHRLHVLSNIDKHRRLPLLAWSPEMTYWTEQHSPARYRWRPAPFVPYEDGAVLGVLFDPQGGGAPDATVFHEIRLLLMDDLAPHSSMTDTLIGWHRSLTSWVLPRVFIVASGQPAPMLIVTG